MDEIRKLSAKEGQRLLEKLDKVISGRDRDTNPEVKGSGRKYAGVGLYYFEQDVDEPPLPDKGDS